MDTAPFAYVVIEDDGWCGGDKLIAIAATLGEVARLATPRLPRFNGALFGKSHKVTARYASGDSVDVPMVAFARRDDHETDAEILTWIRRRAEKIAAAKAEHPHAEHVWQEAEGIGRCSPSDGEAKQLADYRATADWLWRDDPDEDWWRTYVPEEAEDR